MYTPSESNSSIATYWTGSVGTVPWTVFDGWYTLEVQPPFFTGWFPNHQYFSKVLSSSKKLEQVWRGYQCYGILYGKGGHWLNGGGGEWWLRRNISIYYVVGGYLALKKGHLIHRNKVKKIPCKSAKWIFWVIGNCYFISNCFLWERMYLHWSMLALGVFTSRAPSRSLYIVGPLCTFKMLWVLKM